MTDNYKFNTEYLVDIYTLIRQNNQLIEQRQWDGEDAADLVKEQQRIVEYHKTTGSHYYPLF